jgi:hypothetical protein
MGQYHLIVNHSKREYLIAHKFGDGLKLLEFGSSGCGTMTALAVLLAEDNGKGGGDLHLTGAHPIVGSWANDRIAIVGDYGEDRFDASGSKTNAYSLASAEYRDVSGDVLRAMACDAFLKSQLGERDAEIPEPEPVPEDPAEAFTL